MYLTKTFAGETSYAAVICFVKAHQHNSAILICYPDIGIAAYIWGATASSRANSTRYHDCNRNKRIYCNLCSLPIIIGSKGFQFARRLYGKCGQIWRYFHQSFERLEFKCLYEVLEIMVVPPQSDTLNASCIAHKDFASFSYTTAYIPYCTCACTMSEMHSRIHISRETHCCVKYVWIRYWYVCLFVCR